MTKDELKDELKNRISMALKDPILQQGFEIICKENAELKTVKIPRLERKIASIRGAHSVDCRKLNARTEQVERLKKENAEFRKIAEFQQSSNMSRYFEKKKYEKQLTKAKEIIKDLLSCLYSVEYDRVSDLEEAEQFLKEVSE